MSTYFDVLEPLGAPTPLVVEIPHSSVRVGPRALATLNAPARSIGVDADLYVDQLYRQAPAFGASVLIARVSRYVCDLNRSEQDVDGSTVEGAPARLFPHGLIWRETTESQPVLTRRLSRGEFERRLETIYRPYHQALQGLLKQKYEQFGYAVLLAAHSMPSFGRSGHADPGAARADVVPGTQGRSTAARSVIAAVEEEAKRAGLSLTHDDPYRGGFTTVHYGKPALGFHAIQVELARRLYMDESTLTKLPGSFEKTANFCDRLVQALGQLRKP
ncbi:MAG: N-formylglutamate amidohydrolase [Polyangiaceae bacterium]|nr:N-formylglutamate amidohydrolase [Polyangiaceae bacterium]